MVYVISVLSVLILVFLFRLSVPNIKMGEKQTRVLGKNENVFPETPNIGNSNDLKYHVTDISKDPKEVAEIMITYCDAYKNFTYYYRACNSVKSISSGGLPILVLVDVCLILRAFFSYGIIIDAIIFAASFAVAIALCHFFAPRTTIIGIEEARRKIKSYTITSKEDVTTIHSVSVSYSGAADSIEKIVEKCKEFQVLFFIYSGILLAICL